jgi:alcohol dehydrogenase class IV
MKIGLAAPLLQRLAEAEVFCAVYSGTSADPSTQNVEDALRLYRENHCEAIIAFGGGSPLDCAKMAGLSLAYPRKKIEKIRGIQPIMLRVPPPLFAVPTTAGTGSEVTLAAVMTDSDTHRKYAVLTPKLCPKVAVLDPELTIGLPPHITAATGMDALTHAVEAYIGKSNTRRTGEAALIAVRLIFKNLEPAYQDNENLVARGNMLQASYEAGIAFTRAYVGYAHGIAHALGGLYNIPHGLACAVVLPHVLAFYGETAHKRLSELAAAAGITQGLRYPAEKAEAFIQAIRGMNERMGLPSGFDCIREEDIPSLAAQALKESNPLYPVPKLMNQAQCEALVQGLVPGR